MSDRRTVRLGDASSGRSRSRLAVPDNLFMSCVKLLQILALSAALSVYSAWVLASRPARTEIPANGIPLLRTPDAHALWQKPATVFIDVRSAADYGYGHIAGAINVPEEEFESRLPKLRAPLESAGAIVVYCKNVDCGKSLWAAIRLRNAGLMQTKIYPAGWNEWQLRGLPTRSTATR